MTPAPSIPRTCPWLHLHQLRPGLGNKLLLTRLLVLLSTLLNKRRNVNDENDHVWCDELIVIAIVGKELK